MNRITQGKGAFVLLPAITRFVIKGQGRMCGIAKYIRFHAKYLLHLTRSSIYVFKLGLSHSSACWTQYNVDSRIPEFALSYSLSGKHSTVDSLNLVMIIEHCPQVQVVRLILTEN